MNLRLWNSNLKKFLNMILEEFRDHNTITSVIGLYWNCKTDMFTITVPKTPASEIKGTKRDVMY